MDLWPLWIMEKGQQVLDQREVRAKYLDIEILVNEIMTLPAAASRAGAGWPGVRHRGARSL
jgi:hypothetical protein